MLDNTQIIMYICIIKQGKLFEIQKKGGKMEIMTLEEQKQVLIDNYINLLRIKAAEQGQNKELDLQIAVTKTKMQSFSIDTAGIEKMFE